MSRIYALLKNMGVVVAIFCSTMAVVAIGNNSYSDDYTVSAGMR